MNLKIRSVNNVFLYFLTNNSAKTEMNTNSSPHFITFQINDVMLWISGQVYFLFKRTILASSTEAASIDQISQILHCLSKVGLPPSFSQ